MVEAQDDRAEAERTGDAQQRRERGPHMSAFDAREITPQANDRAIAGADHARQSFLAQAAPLAHLTEGAPDRIGSRAVARVQKRFVEVIKVQTVKVNPQRFVTSRTRALGILVQAAPGAGRCFLDGVERRHGFPFVFFASERLEGGGSAKVFDGKIAEERIKLRQTAAPARSDLIAGHDRNVAEERATVKEPIAHAL